MIFSTKVSRIWIAQNKTDFRKQHAGALGEMFKLGIDPFAGDLVIFVGRRRNRLRVVYADSNGLWLATKKFTLETMKTHFRFLDDPSCNQITHAELAIILEGSAYQVTRKVKPYPDDGSS